jgi:hypothetical protein
MGFGLPLEPALGVKLVGVVAVDALPSVKAHVTYYLSSLLVKRLLRGIELKAATDSYTIESTWKTIKKQQFLKYPA